MGKSTEILLARRRREREQREAERRAEAGEAESETEDAVEDGDFWVCADCEDPEACVEAEECEDGDEGAFGGLM